jgi:hypothetical protein
MKENKEEESLEKDPIKSLVGSFGKKLSLAGIKRLAKYVAAVIDKLPIDTILAAIVLFSVSAAIWTFNYRTITLYRYIFIGSAATTCLCFVGLVWHYLRKKKSKDTGSREENTKHPAPSSASIPVVIKDGTTFGISDGEISKRLERELSQLLTFVNDEEAAVIVLRGKPGSGKTSLLHAGLEYCLKQVDIPCVYWEAKPANALQGLKLESALGIELNTNARGIIEIPQQRLVVILDQFEHLHNEIQEHKPLFDFVRNMCRAAPRHKIQLVIAFRDEYLDEWIEFETALCLQNPIARIVLEPLSAETAKEIMVTMLREAGLTVEDKVVRDYVKTLAHEKGVSPVAIGIGLRVMAKSALANDRKEITAATFATAKGASAIFSVHVRQWLEDYIEKNEWEAFVTTLHDELVTTTAKIRSSGATAEAIAVISNLDIKHITSYLNSLASRDARILERVIGHADQYYYRLANEQLIPALEGLLHERSLGRDSTAEMFDRHYEQWKSDERVANLLKGKALRAVLAVKDRLVQGSDIFEKARYLTESQRGRRQWRWRLATVGMFTGVVLVAVWGIALDWLDVRHTHIRLISWRLPPDLFERQSQLTSLSIERPEMKELAWLRSSKLSELTIEGFGSGSVSGIKNITNIQELTIHCNQKQLREELDALAGGPKFTGDLEWCRNRPDLSSIVGLEELKLLDLDLEASNVEVLPALDQLKHLQRLKLNCKNSQLRKVPVLNPGLLHLELLVDSSKVDDFSSLANIDHLKSLTLSLNEPFLRKLPVILRSLHTAAPFDLSLHINVTPLDDIPDLSGIQGLQKLTLNLEYAKIQSMNSLRNVQGIEELELFLNHAYFSDLSILPTISGLQKIKLHLKNTEIQQLPKIFDQMKTVVLELDASKIEQLPYFGDHGLQELRISLSMSKISKLDEIYKPVTLETLMVDASSARMLDLTPIASLRELRDITLHLNWSQIAEIEGLAHLPKLKCLTLYIGGSENQNLDFLNEFQNVEHLIVNLEETDLKKFPDISRMQNLHHLTLNLERSHVRDLSTLSLPLELQRFDLDIAQSEVKILPNVAQLKQLSSIKLDVSHSQIHDFSQIRGWSKLEELTLDPRFQSLQELPPSVTKLNFVQ